MLSGPLEQSLRQGCSQELLITTILAYKQNELPFDSSCEKQASRPAVRVWMASEGLHKLQHTQVKQVQFINPTFSWEDRDMAEK